MEDAQARRERLRALKEAAALVGEPQVPAGEPQLRFRNYAVRDQSIEHRKLEPAKAPEFKEPPAEVEVEAEDLTKQQRPEDVLINVAPKKANWDLKRDIQKKLDKLERRTQRAILEILQEEEKKRLEELGGIQD